MLVQISELHKFNSNSINVGKHQLKFLGIIWKKEEQFVDYVIYELAGLIVPVYSLESLDWWWIPDNSDNSWQGEIFSAQSAIDIRSGH